MSTTNPYPENNLPEIWGGIECTINRVGSSWRDQFLMCDHYDREEDIERIATLGIKKIRYAVLWEKHQQERDQPIDWSWASRQLASFAKHHIEPIIGLVHHGSGPHFTNLYDDAFPELLAGYARQFAEQFPDINYYTPVNEPLTTGRFSGLYGLWYPHHKNEHSFVKMLLNQLKAIILCMREIRKINPKAQLVQTEDLSRTHSTPALQYQADFENKRRWLTYDILCGLFNEEHFFWKYFLDLGIPENELVFFRDHSCTPDIMGFNYYVTSERYLDEAIQNYPEWTHGGNGRMLYADTEAVRSGKSAGLESLLAEAWERYKIPIAVTECHLSCTREEQLRWFHDCWLSCCASIKKGIDIRALTAWSLLGAYDWNNLLTKESGHYEPGAFDLFDHHPRMTALGKLIQELAQKGNADHPLLNQDGWWNKGKQTGLIARKKSNSKTRPLLIIGKNGTLGTAFMKICEWRSIPFVAQSRQELDVMKPEQLRRVLDRFKPWAVINTTGYVRVDDAESNREECFAVNAIAPGEMAKIAREKGIRFMTFSSDLVFNGDKTDPYHEEDSVQPINVYGESKAKGERNIISGNPQSLIIRSSAFFGPWDPHNFIYKVWKSLQEERPFHVVNDVVISPTYVPDLVNTALDLFIDEEEGIWHLTNEGTLSWAELASAVAQRKGLKENNLIHKPLEEMEWAASRPKNSALISARGAKMATLDNALQRYFDDCSL